MKLVNSYSNRWDGIILEKRKKKDYPASGQILSL